MPRPLGEAMRSTKPNELIHWDYIYMGQSDEGFVYLLVIKDDASHFVRLHLCTTADAATTYDALMDWFTLFGVCYNWVSDQGTHFKNEVIEALRHSLGAHHHFTTARCPWANGTVEVVSRELLKVTRKLLSEWRLPSTAYARVVKVVGMVLNQSPSPTLGEVAPCKAMMGLDPSTPLELMVVPTDPPTSMSVDAIRDLVKTEIQALQRALEGIHKSVAEN